MALVAREELLDIINTIWWKLVLGSFSFDIAGVLSIFVDLNGFNCAVPCECEIFGYPIFLDCYVFDVVAGAGSP